jgi:hypothetical protein
VILIVSPSTLTVPQAESEAGPIDTSCGYSCASNLLLKKNRRTRRLKRGAEEQGIAIHPFLRRCVDHQHFATRPQCSLQFLSETNALDGGYHCMASKVKATF